MKTVSWNVHRCIGTDELYRPERIVEVLKRLDADLIALQEIDSSLRVENEIDQLTFIADALGMQKVIGPTLQRDYGAYGNAILSRYPIESYEEFDLSYRKFEPRGVLAAEVSWCGHRVRILNTHLGLKYWERSSQIDRLLSELTWSGQALVILLGDFNEWIPFSGNNLRLERSFLRSPRLATFPSHWPRFALDRIFFSGAVRNVVHQVVKFGGLVQASDHLPVLASFEWDSSNLR